MKSVWVIEQGSYSDYRVVGVFDSEENAQTVLGVIKLGDPFEEPTIAEWPMNPAVAELNAGLNQYCVHMRKDGTTEHCDKRSIASYNLTGEVRMWRRSQAPAYAEKNAEDVLTATVWAKDEAHAVKIVNESRTRLIANGEWDKDA